MTDGPKVWDINEDINIELFIADPNTGAGSTGQSGNITFTLQRLSDDKYWDSASWVTPLTNLTMTEVDYVNQKGRYSFTLSSSGNTSEGKYLAHTIVNDPPIFDGAEAYELHVSRDLTPKTYESEPSIRS